MDRDLMRFLLPLLLVVALSMPALAAEQVVPNGIQRIGAVNATYEPLDYSAVNVAVVDTGIDLHNPDLNVVGGVDCTTPVDMNPYMQFADAQFSVEAFTDASWDRFRNLEATGYDDAMGHGTHVAGIIGARDDGRGVVGVAPNASLWSVRVLDANGGGTLENIICGLQWILDTRAITHIAVVNMSLGADVGVPVMDYIESCTELYPPPAPVYLEQPTKKMPDPLHEVICELSAAGIPVVVAAGNGDGLAEETIPAAYPEVITVSSFVDNDGVPGGLGGRNDLEVCGFGGADDMFFAHHNFTPEQRMQSYSGEAVDISAPGVCVLSTVPGGFAALTGTSMATPHVTGIIARFAGDAGNLYGLMGVEDIRLALLVAAERQPSTFGDIDEYLEPIARVIGTAVDCPPGWCEEAR